MDFLWAKMFMPTPPTLKRDVVCINNLFLAFGNKAITQQCAKLGVNMIVRGHQVVDTGAQLTNKNRVLTLFSAPSYSDDYHNSAAVLKVCFLYLLKEKSRSIECTR